MICYQNKDILEVGIDKSVSNILLGRIFISGVILPNNFEELCSEEDIEIDEIININIDKEREEFIVEFIKKIAIDYSVIYKDPDDIDKYNIYDTIIKGMHEIINNLKIKPEKILVNNDYFKTYKDEGIIPHECVVGGDKIYLSIAVASLLAKSMEKRHVKELESTNIEEENIELNKNEVYLEHDKIQGKSFFNRDFTKFIKINIFINGLFLIEKEEDKLFSINLNIYEFENYKKENCDIIRTYIEEKIKKYIIIKIKENCNNIIEISRKYNVPIKNILYSYFINNRIDNIEIIWSSSSIKEFRYVPIKHYLDYEEEDLYLKTKKFKFKKFF